ncbi:PTS glucitol/sorbitol transporter subunit IIA [Evansella sp. LMS18]|uniref:PTS glucitol/sorbitol transporter subunit IIA n=1 Tax=Evansella sp. LMS18 TaxID=2924033 RepID=UPI0020D1C748|nr:PTS glucitol/sorbitol transporter subunit IIA [Evansella sp. LMS18]UTR10219.1 PTS glucitol/sorbitol transporter subunit IIA [Evansella sp. LMS18]
MTTIYETNVSKVGPLVEEFYGEKMVILFKEGAPEELQEYCVLHAKNQLDGEIQAGDSLFLNEKEYKVTAVGDAVNKNLQDLGHITLKFNGESSADLPGTLVLEDQPIEPINEGATISIIRN